LFSDVPPVRSGTADSRKWSLGGIRLLLHCPIPVSPPDEAERWPNHLLSFPGNWIPEVETRTSPLTTDTPCSGGPIPRGMRLLALSPPQGDSAGGGISRKTSDSGDEGKLLIATCGGGITFRYPPAVVANGLLMDSCNRAPSQHPSHRKTASPVFHDCPYLAELRRVEYRKTPTDSGTGGPAMTLATTAAALSFLACSRSARFRLALSCAACS